LGVPVFLYEKSERGHHEAALPALRQGGFEALQYKLLRPDFGPPSPHERLGATIVGARDFLIAMNVNLATADLRPAKKIAAEIRALRAEGEARFLGVRALGFPLGSRGLTQVSMNLTLPDLTPVDPVIEWIEERARDLGASIAETELIGVIRDVDVPTALRLQMDPAQVVAAD